MLNIPEPNVMGLDVWKLGVEIFRAQWAKGSKGQ